MKKKQSSKLFCSCIGVILFYNFISKEIERKKKAQQNTKICNARQNASDDDDDDKWWCWCRRISYTNGRGSTFFKYFQKASELFDMAR